MTNGSSSSLFFRSAISFLILRSSVRFLLRDKQSAPSFSTIYCSSWLLNILRYGLPQIAPSLYSSLPALMPSTMKSRFTPYSFWAVTSLRVAPLRFHSPYSAISQPLISHLLMILHLNAVAHLYTKFENPLSFFLYLEISFLFVPAFLIKFLLLFLFRYHRLYIF